MKGLPISVELKSFSCNAHRACLPDPKKLRCTTNSCPLILLMTRLKNPIEKSWLIDVKVDYFSNLTYMG